MRENEWGLWRHSESSRGLRRISRTWFVAHFGDIDLVFAGCRSIELAREDHCMLKAEKLGCKQGD